VTSYGWRRTRTSDALEKQDFDGPPGSDEKRDRQSDWSQNRVLQSSEGRLKEAFEQAGRDYRDGNAVRVERNLGPTEDSILFFQQDRGRSDGKDEFRVAFEKIDEIGRLPSGPREQGRPLRLRQRGDFG
jgi:hypothetical protein